MPAQLNFRFQFDYPDRPEGIRLPATLTFGGKAVHTHAYVDPGAAFCVFSREIGEKLGLNIESGIPKRMGSLVGTLDTFGHEVTLQTLEVSFQSFVYFAKYPGLQRNLLGRQGGLRNLKVGLIDYDNLLYLSAYDS